MKTLLKALAIAGLSSSTLLAQDIIPLPAKMETDWKKASFVLSDKTALTYSDDSLKPSADILAAQIKKMSGYELTVSKSDKATENSIHLQLDSNYQPKVRLPKQAYKLEANQSGVSIIANDKAGIFYGTVTITQLLPADNHLTKDPSWTIPKTSIEDAPSFPWRGVMLDVSRYFFNKEYIKRYLDMMAMHKLNVFHWHLIDDCGWRIEIKKYPKLTEIGAKRGEGRFYHEGFYTQADIKEIVAYAAARNIEVVPEIEIPAHTQSALAAYPHLGCFDKKLPVPDRHSISPEIYCAGKESTYEFLEDVMDEVVELFPSKWVHIGGDEAKYKNWKACPHCQERKKKEGFSEEKQLQGYMTQRMEKYLATKGKAIIGWDEILDTGITNKSGIMTWHKPNTAIKGAKRGNPVVMSLVRHTYFDTPESKLPGEPPCATWTPPVSLQKAYEWHPVPEGLDAKSSLNILGPNACVWTDRFLHNRDVLHDKPGEGTKHSEAYLDYITLPRLAALSEVGWTPKALRNYDSFTERMSLQYHRYLENGYNFRVPTPLIEAKRNAKQELIITAKPPVKYSTVRYTTDGSEPNADSRIFLETLTLAKDKTFKAKTFINTDKTSLTYTHLDEVNKYAKYGKVIGKWEAGKIAAKTPHEETFDATGIIDSNGTYEITFLYTKGAQGLSIESAKIVRNDTDLMGGDTHKGFSGGKKIKNVYTIKVNGYETGASFKVKAMICGDTGNNSNGLVLINKK